MLIVETSHGPQPHLNDIAYLNLPLLPTNPSECLRDIDRFIDAINHGSGYQNSAVLDLTKISPEIEIIFVGDLHARVNNFRQILSHRDNWKRVLDHKAILVLLGDIVHREHLITSLLADMGSSIEILNLMMNLKIMSPNGFYPLLGNHDFLRSGYAKGGILQGEKFEAALRGQFPRETEDAPQIYINRHDRYIEQSPILVIANGVVAVHAGPISNLSLEDMQKIRRYDVHLRDQSKPIKQATWSQFRNDYFESDINDFLVRCGQRNGILLGGHQSPGPSDLDWYKKLTERHYILQSCKDRVGYASLLNEKVVFYSWDRNFH